LNSLNGNAVLIASAAGGNYYFSEYVDAAGRGILKWLWK